MYFDKKKPFKGDKFNSTYKFYIVLDDRHPRNKIPMLEGYSKDEGTPEPNDKAYLLVKEARVCLEYLADGRALEAALVMRPDMSYTWQYAHEILRLWPDTYEIASQEAVNDYVVRELDEIYRVIGEKKSLKDVPKPKSPDMGKPYLRQLEAHLRKQSFKTLNELNVYCEEKIATRGKEITGVMQDFWRRYKAKWFAS